MYYRDIGTKKHKDVQLYKSQPLLQLFTSKVVPLANLNVPYPSFRSM